MVTGLKDLEKQGGYLVKGCRQNNVNVQKQNTYSQGHAEEGGV